MKKKKLKKLPTGLSKFQQKSTQYNFYNQLWKFQCPWLKLFGPPIRVCYTKIQIQHSWSTIELYHWQWNTFWFNLLIINSSFWYLIAWRINNWNNSNGYIWIVNMIVLIFWYVICCELFIRVFHQTIFLLIFSILFCFVFS